VVSHPLHIPVRARGFVPLATLRLLRRPAAIHSYILSHYAFMLQDTKFGFSEIETPWVRTRA